MRTATIVLALLAAPLAAAAVVEGRVAASDGTPLPGCTVTLKSAAGSREILTGQDGRYRIDEVPAGAYEIRFELAGLETVERRIDVGDAAVAVDVELNVGPITETITFACGTVCNDVPPATKFEWPLCADTDLHDALIHSVERGDRSALVLLRRRYETADTYGEQFRLAKVLLEHLPNSDAVWKELSEHASFAVRFPKDENGAYPPELEQYCAQRNVDTEEFWSMSFDALSAARNDPRSRTLLHQALKTSDSDLILLAIVGFGEQQDSTALPAIATALERLGDEASTPATALALFETTEADALAFKYIPENERAGYLRERRQLEDVEEDEEN